MICAAGDMLKNATVCRMHKSFLTGIASIICSAVLYGVAYWYPVYCWWGTFASMLIIMRVQGSPRCFVLYGCVWASIAYGMHLAAVIVGIVYLAAQYTWYAWLPGISLIAYMALVTGFVWGSGVCVERYLYRYISSVIGTISVRVVWLSLYWYCMTYIIFLPLGQCEGCLLLNPLIPCAERVAVLRILSHIGVTWCTLLFCGCIGLCASCVALRTMHSLFVIVISFMCVYIFLSGHVREAGGSDSIVVAHVPKTVPSTDLYKAACTMMHDYVAVAAKEAVALCGAVFPESAVYAWHICADGLLAQYASCHETGIHDYIIGSFYDEDGLYRNSCYWLHDGIVYARFDKRHAMPLIERLPWFLRGTLFQALFFNEMPEITPSYNARPCMKLGEYSFVPYICSELFFNRLPDDAYHEVPIIALVNDRWCQYTYMQYLMYLGALVQAHAWSRNILYVAYSRCTYITLF